MLLSTERCRQDHADTVDHRILTTRTGSIRFRGRDISSEPSHVISRLGIGLVPQGRRVFPSLTVLENLLVARRAPTGSVGWDQARVLDRFPRLSERLRLAATS